MPGTVHPLLGVRKHGEAKFVGEQWLSPATPWFIGQHRVFDAAVLPGAALVEWALAAACAARPQQAVLLTDLQIESALRWRLNEDVLVRAEVDTSAQPETVRCFSQVAGAWQEHLSARIAARHDGSETPPAAVDPAHLVHGLGEVPLDGYYEGIRRLGIDYGAAYRGLRQLWRQGRRVVGRVSVPDITRDGGLYTLHPVAVDACFHLIGAFFDAAHPAPEIPVGIDRLVVHRPVGADLWCTLDSREAMGDAARVVDLRVFDLQGQPLVEMHGVRFKRVGAAVLATGQGEVAAATGLQWYGVQWQPAPSPAAASRERAPGTWLLCAAAENDATAWATEFARLGVVDAQALEAPALPAAVARLRREGRRVAGLLLPAPPLAHGSDASDPTTAAYALAGRGLDAVRTFVSAVDSDDAAIVLVTHCAFGPAGVQQPAALAGSVWTGLARAVATECPHLRCVQADLPSEAGAPVLSELLAHVGALGGAGHLALRDGQWFQAQLAPIEWPTDATPAVRVRADASYLVTGAFGGLGPVVAQWLVERGARSLVLVGRHVPAEAAWIDAWREAGLRVTVRELDVADETAMRRLFDDIARKLPPLRGIVHAAGLTDDAMLTQVETARCAAVLDPKVRGGWNLHHLSAGLELDFLVFFSALASLLGSPGQGSYIMANSFLDALAHHRRAQGLPALAINWGPWAQAGMAARRGLVGRMQAQGIEALDNIQALQAFEQLLSLPVAQAGIARVDWAVLLAASARLTPDTFFGAVAPSADGVACCDLGELADLPPAEARERLLDALLGHVARARGLNTNDRRALLPGFADTRMNSLGLDSLMVIQMRNRLLAGYGVNVSLQQVMGGATAGEIADGMLQQILLRQLTRAADAPAADDLETELI